MRSGEHCYKGMMVVVGARRGGARGYGRGCIPRRRAVALLLHRTCGRASRVECGTRENDTTTRT